MGTYDQRGWNGNSAVINGGQIGQPLVTFDGIAAQDSGAPGLSTYQAPSVDAIGEVRLLTGNYAAEYGARNGGQINVSIKNGTGQFHGSAYYYYRHEEFNANEWFFNQLGQQKPKYRYENPGGTVGGPVIIPKVRFNKDYNRLFFFYSWDQLWNTQSTALNKYTMPTALERQGDFSQSVNTNGSQILIRDPLTGASCSTAGAAGCFPGNKIPLTRLNAIGSAMLSRFPLPSTTDPTGQHQYNFTDVLQNVDPRRDNILRVDYNIATHDTLFVRLLQDYQAQSGFGAILGAAGDGWGQFPHRYFIPSAGFASTYVHTFRPNLINEMTVGQNRAHQQNVPTDPASYKASQLPFTSGGQALTLPSIFGPAGNCLNLLPTVNFGLPSGFTAQSAPTGIPNLPSFGFDSRWPFDGTDSLLTFSNNLTWIKGRHTLKFGGDARRLRALGPGNGQRSGADLGRDEAIELAHAVAEALRESFDAFPVDDAVAYEAHRPGRHVGAHVPLRRTRGGIGPAAQAGAKAGLLRGGGRRVEAHVLALRGARRAAGPAVDPGRRDSGEEHAVESGIFAVRRLVATFRVFDHHCIVTRRSAKY